jgi:hypothetical protein
MQPLPTDLLGVRNGNHPDGRLLRGPTADGRTMQKFPLGGRYPI